MSVGRAGDTSGLHSLFCLDSLTVGLSSPKCERITASTRREVVRINKGSGSEAPGTEEGLIQQQPPLPLSLAWAEEWPCAGLAAWPTLHTPSSIPIFTAPAHPTYAAQGPSEHRKLLRGTSRHSQGLGMAALISKEMH